MNLTAEQQSQLMRTLRALELRALLEVWTSRPLINQRTLIPRIEKLVVLCAMP